MENASELMPELRLTCCCCDSAGIRGCAAFEAKMPRDVARKEEEEEFPAAAPRPVGKAAEPETAARAGHGEHDGATLGRISCNEQDGADGAQSCREGLAAGNEL